MKQLKLLTRELEHRFAHVGRQEEKGDEAIVIAKFFTPDSNWTWYLTEYDPESREFFGLVDGFEAEMGYISLDELTAARGPLGLPIERDQWWKETSLREVRRMIDERRAA
jgi:hypothetical protein